jgi:hypothetical protein
MELDNEGPTADKDNELVVLFVNFLAIRHVMY